MTLVVVVVVGLASPWHHLGHDGTMKLERNTKQGMGNQEQLREKPYLHSVKRHTGPPQISQEEAPITPTSLTTFMLHAV